MVNSRATAQRPLGKSSAKVVLITGCSSGIGLATAELLTRRGHIVYATVRREESLAALQQQLAGSGGRAVACRLDVTEPASIDSIVERVAREQRRLDVLVNNAGYGQFGAVEDVPIEEWRAQFETNVLGIVRTTQAFLPLLRGAYHGGRCDGRIVNVSSAVAHVSTPLMGSYNASKHATRALSAAVRMELARWGIDVIEIEPGFIATSFRDNVQKHVAQARPRTALYRDAYEAFEQRWRKLTARQMAQPGDVAEAIRKAVEARRPRACYRVTLAAKWVPLLPVLVPRRVLAWSMLRIFGLRSTLGRRLPPS